MPHTPAPWRLESATELGLGWDGWILRGPREGDELGTCNGPQDHAESRATAHLIAAAPDLLAALRECADELETEIEHRYGDGIKEHPTMRQRYERDMSVVRHARAVVARAEGEER
jgi:hypothetical protein